jgi:hypothetical protein
MKPIYFILLSCLLASCSLKVNRFYYVLEEPVSLYPYSTYKGGPVKTLNKGDTVRATGTKHIQLGGPVPVEYEGYSYYAESARATYLRAEKVNPRKDAAKSAKSLLEDGHFIEPNSLTQYRYVLLNQAEAYEGQGKESRRLQDLMPGDTISITGSPIKMTPWRLVEHKGYRFYTLNSSVYGIPPVRIAKRSAFHYKPIGQLSSYKHSPEEYTPSNNGYTPSTGAAIHTGPRGGRYYINSNGNKSYVPRSGSSGGYRRK